MVSTTAAAASARIASTTISSTSVKPFGRGRLTVGADIRILVGPAGGAIGAERPDVERRSARPRRLVIIGAAPRVGGQLLDVAAAAIAFGLRERGRRGDERVQPVAAGRSEEHTSELQSLMRISYAVF